VEKRGLLVYICRYGRVSAVSMVMVSSSRGEGEWQRRNKFELQSWSWNLSPSPASHPALLTAEVNKVLDSTFLILSSNCLPQHYSTLHSRTFNTINPSTNMPPKKITKGATGEANEGVSATNPLLIPTID
jgi:hypothetical protein